MGKDETYVPGGFGRRAAAAAAAGGRSVPEAKASRHEERRGRKRSW
jgi:hypothetical protein